MTPAGIGFGQVEQGRGTLAMACAFEVLPYSPGKRLSSVRVVRRAGGEHPEAWAIVDGGSSTLSRDGYWEYESLPSSRTEEYFRRCRWPSAAEAIAFARVHLHTYPDGYKPFEDET